MGSSSQQWSELLVLWLDALGHTAFFRVQRRPQAPSEPEASVFRCQAIDDGPCGRFVDDPLAHERAQNSIDLHPFDSKQAL